MIVAVDTIARNFERGAIRYNELATLQQEVVQDLFSRIKSYAQGVSSIVDLGCGTGQLLHLCSQVNPDAVLTGVDLSAAMLEQAVELNQRITIKQVSLESSGLAEKSADLVLSSSAFQWVDLAAAFKESARIAKPGAVVAVSCFGRGTIAAWRRLWGMSDCFMPEQHDLYSSALAAGLSVSESTTQLMTAKFTEFNQAMASVRGVGAGGGRQNIRRSYSRKVLQQAQRRFQQQVDQEGVFEMRYPVHTIVARNEK